MPSAALALTNGKIWTGGESFGRSVVLRGGRIESVDGAVPAGARVVDLRGRLVVPGFVDNHVHLVMGGLQLSRVQLRDAATAEEFVRRIGRQARKLGRGEWVTGGGWDEQSWDPAVLPARQWVDCVSLDHPVFVSRQDVHMGLANTAALQLAGVTRETPDPPGGTIVRGAGGEPTGILKDAAMNLVAAHVPPPSPEERRSAIRAALREAARNGVTSFCEMAISDGAWEDLDAFRRLDEEGALTARVVAYLPVASWHRLADPAVRKRSAGGRLRIAGLKGFADGSLGSSTAAFREPYAGEPDNRGLLMQPMLDGSMARWIAGADEAGLQLAIHAIGDRANEKVLAIFESRPRHRERRFRIEHAQHLGPELVRRFAAAGVVASVQPHHAADDGRWAVSRIGERRAAWAFPFRSLLDAGAVVTFGSDWPVAPLDPIAAIAAAVTRRTVDGGSPEGWIPAQKISVAEALRCATANSAWAVFAEDELGTIAPGMRADLAVLSGDLFTIPPEEIEQVRVEMTIFDGDVIQEP